MTEAGTVRLQAEGALATITIDDPSTRNAIGPAEADAIIAMTHAVSDDPEARLLAVTGNGVFSSGAAIRAWEDLDGSGATLNERGNALCDAFERCHVPVVALLGGHAVGGAAEVALAADWRVMDPRAEMRFVHTGFGLMPGFGGLGRLAAIVGRAKALEIAGLRSTIGADEALALGLADAIVPAADQAAWAEARAAALEGADRGALAAIKRALTDGDERTAFLEVWPHRRLPERLDGR